MIIEFYFIGIWNIYSGFNRCIYLIGEVYFLKIFYFFIIVFYFCNRKNLWFACKIDRNRYTSSSNWNLFFKNIFINSCEFARRNLKFFGYLCVFFNSEKDFSITTFYSIVICIFEGNIEIVIFYFCIDLSSFTRMDGNIIIIKGFIVGMKNKGVIRA